MATYVYECRWGHRFGRVFKMGEAPETVRCLDDKSWAERVITTPSVHFNGQGFTRSSVGAETKK